MIRSLFVLFASILCLCLLIAAPAMAFVLPVSTETLLENSEVLVHGYVLETHTEHGDKDGEINTVVSLFTLESLKGKAPDQFQISLPGGTLDGRFMLESDIPFFEAGEEVVLFLDESLSKITGRTLGKATIEGGLVIENMIDAGQYLASLRNLVAGFAPVIDLDVPFKPSSTIDAYTNRYSPQFGYSNLHWPLNDDGSIVEVKVTINENCEDVTGEGAVVKASMQTWNDVPANFAFKYDGKNNKTESMANGINEVFWSDEDMDSAIAYVRIFGGGQTITECDMTILESYDWSVKDKPGHDEMDVQAITTHEFGHFLCLNDLYDPEDSDKTMYGYGGPGVTGPRSLHDDDKDGIIFIYGHGPGVEEEGPAPPDNVDSGLTTDACEEIIQTLYGTCSFKLTMSGGSAISEQKAFDECDYGSSNKSWLCIDDCFQSSDGCSDLAACIQETCDSQVISPKSDEEEEDDGGSCGG